MNQRTPNKLPTSSSASPVKVFISYAKEDGETAKRLYDDLKTAGLTPWMDAVDLLPGQHRWQTIAKTIRESDFFIAVLSDRSLTQRGEYQKELNNALEILDEFPPDDIFLLPVRVDDCEPVHEKLIERQSVDLFPSYEEGLKKILRAMKVHLSTRKEHSSSSQCRISFPSLETPSSARLFLNKLPISGPDLFGREKELEKLDKAWENPATNVLSLVAWGGTGKTALVNHWVCSMGENGYRGAERAYAWSFYSQGASEGKQASADEFLNHALKWFGDPAPMEGSAADKGARLADLVRQAKTLLILDGLEPLQHPPGTMQGRLKDQGLQALLRNLAHGNPGVCVITTRLAVADLEFAEKSGAPRIDLESLPVEAGTHLLKHLGVNGSDKEIEKTVNEYGCHALSLNLLGTYLKTAFGGAIQQRDRIPKLTEARKHGEHARRVMAAYETHLAGTPELNILYMMGLFDRPVEPGAIAALRENQPSGNKKGFVKKFFSAFSAKPDYTDFISAVTTISDVQWAEALASLRSLKLLAAEDPQRKDTLDCHPLIREYFGERLQTTNPAACKEAHSRLYEYYKSVPEKELPDTLEEMEPLFAACAHGCMAERHQEAMDEVYWERIKRKNEHYCTAKLGAFGSDLSALSNFFDDIWFKPASGLTKEDQAAVLSWAGFRLRALGRLREAAQPMQAGLDINIKDENWKHAAMNAGNLSELWLTLGEVEKAVDYARQSVDFADRSGDAFQKELNRTTLADALHQAGDLSEAEDRFREAEAMQKERQPEYPFLYSLRGFQFCDLLLSRGRYADVLERALKFIEWRMDSDSLLDISLDKLSLGRAHLHKALTEKTGDFTEAVAWLNAAVDGLREAGRQDVLPLGLLARAEHHRHTDDFNHAQTDLAEALEIAELGEMKLFLTDCHLESCRLCKAMNRPEAAENHRRKARALIEETGYHRRDGEVDEAPAVV